MANYRTIYISIFILDVYIGYFREILHAGSYFVFDSEFGNVSEIFMLDLVVIIMRLSRDRLSLSF